MESGARLDFSNTLFESYRIERDLLLLDFFVCVWRHYSFKRGKVILKVLKVAVVLSKESNVDFNESYYKVYYLSINASFLLLFRFSYRTTKATLSPEDPCVWNVWSFFKIMLRNDIKLSCCKSDQ